jgi:CTP synthase
MAKFIFVAGGVMSGVGKGTAVSSIGKILQARGFRVTAMKIDPYINVDAGTMNPTEHGEVFVTEDGDETDQDLGNYERFLDQDTSRLNYMTTGRVYLTVIEKERNLEYGGRCVEVFSDIPEEVIRRIQNCAKKTKADIVLIEIGGTVGEYQNILFLEAARIMKLKSPDDILFILLSYLPIPSKIGEMKTKPTQNAVRTVNEAGIQPQIILCRAEVPIDEPRKRKIAFFCNVDSKDIISAPDVDSIYEIPLNFEREELSTRILSHLKLRSAKTDLHEWKTLVQRIAHPKRTVRIAMVGKYFETGNFVLTDSYLSVIEAVKHASAAQSVRPEIAWVSSERFEEDPKLVKELAAYDGIIVPVCFV